MSENMIKLSKKAGGSVIDHKPLFSDSSKLLFVGCGSILRVFNTLTGEHVQDVEINAISIDKTDGCIVDVCLHPFQRTSLILCFEEGRVIVWSFEMNRVMYNKVFDVDGKRVVRMKLFVVSEEYETFDVILATSEPDCNYMKLSIYSFNTAALKSVLQKRFGFLMHSWSITEHGGKDFLAGVCDKTLIVFNLKTRKLNRDILIGSDRFFTCVACHPFEECLAVGDNIGRVILYYDFLQQNNKSPHFIYHWHTLPVNDVVFLQSGKYLYSGGNEHVLVKWTLDAPEIRHFLPRLAAPIVHITISPDNQYLALSTLDNSILIVNALQKIHCTLQQFTWGFINVPSQKLFPSGLAIDPRSNCIVLNGKPGHIQFYSPQYSSLLHNMDVIGQNYVSQERSITISNAEVIAVQFSANGKWLTTAQSRSIADFCSDTLLKFWSFDHVSQTYSLDSCITLQHEIIKIVYQPNYECDREENDLIYLVATQCSDKKFRLWINCPHQGLKTLWSCHSIGYYRDYTLSDVCFSSDGSLLGATFGPCLTLWDTDTCEMKCSLAKGSQSLRRVVFAHKESPFVAIACTDSTIYAWNLLSLTLIWSLDLNVSLLIADPRSDCVAVFSSDSNLYVFKASSPGYIYRHEKLCDGDILSAIFFPNSTMSTSRPDVPWLRNSSLYFFTSNQELMAFESRNEEFSLETLKLISEKSGQTSFESLLARRCSSDVNKDHEKSYLKLGLPWSQAISQFISLPAHAMPSVYTLCESLLQSFIVKR